MTWTLLVIAGVLEVGWAIGLKTTEGFTRLIPSVSTIAAVGSVGLLGVATRTLPIGTADGVWVGLGAAVLGIMLFKEPGRMVVLSLLLASLIGHKVTSGHQPRKRACQDPFADVCAEACFRAS